MNCCLTCLVSSHAFVILRTEIYIRTSHNALLMSSIAYLHIIMLMRIMPSRPLPIRRGRRKLFGTFQLSSPLPWLLLGLLVVLVVVVMSIKSTLSHTMLDTDKLLPPPPPQTSPEESSSFTLDNYLNSLDPNQLPPHCDPRIPVDRHDTKRWDDLHAALVQDASATTSSSHTLFLGDSLTERWRGTLSLGKEAVPRIAQVFRRHFGNEALALGAGGDTTMNLLWQLRHGILPKTLQPDVIVLLIGTNNLGRIECDAPSTLAGILCLVWYLRQQRPSARLILHALLPRNEVFGDGNYTLGTKWQRIQWINQQLRQYCCIPGSDGYDPYIHFVDHGAIFLTNATTIDYSLMKDALHPTLAGYELWAPLLAQDIAQVSKQ